MSGGTLATDPAAATDLVRDLQAAARQIDGPRLADPGGDAVFGAATGALAAIPSAGARWRGDCADVLVALAVGVALARSGTVAADSW
jgi:hypothetical protein